VTEESSGEYYVCVTYVGQAERRGVLQGQVRFNSANAIFATIFQAASSC